MKLLLLEEERHFRDNLKKALEKAGHEVILCRDSGTFMDALKDSFDRIVIDVRSWFRGEAMYSYFGTVTELRNVAILFHNTPEGFKSLDGREPAAEDVVIEGSSSVEQIAAAV
ncbi:MAG: hypothetical protein ACQEQV_00065 [Fibrobacterota bacterium]